MSKSSRDEQIAELVKAITAAPTGSGLGMWEGIAAHLVDSGYSRQKHAPAKTPDMGGYVTTGKAAEMLGMTAQTVRDYMRTGYIKGYRVGPRNYRVPMAEVERLLLQAGL